MKVLLGIIIASLLTCQTYCKLNQEHLDLITQIQVQGSCTIILHKLDASDVGAISRKATNPILVITEDDESGKKIEDMFSFIKAKCITLIAELATLDEDSVETLLNKTTDRRVYVFGATLGKKVFHEHFWDSVVYVQSLVSGNVMLYKRIGAKDEKFKRAIIWLKDAKKLLDDSPGFSLRNVDRSTLKGENISVSAVIAYPYVTYDKGKYGGIEIDILKLVSRKMGFSFQVKTESFFVSRNSTTKTLSGIVEHVVSGDSQIGLSTGFMRGVFTFGTMVELSPEIYLVELIYDVLKPKPLTPYFNFVKPFMPIVWLAWLVTFVICTMVSYIMIQFGGKNKMTFWEFCLNMYGTMWQQNLKATLTSPKSGHFCTIFAFWIVGMTFKGAFYNCDLRSFMMKKEYEKPIDTDEDLLQTKTDLYLPAGTGMPETYRDSGSPAKRELYARAVERKTIMTYKAYVDVNLKRKVVRTGGAFLTTKNGVSSNMKDYEKAFGYQPFRTSKYLALAMPSGWTIPLNQPWAEELKLTILQILAGGIVNKITSDNIPRNKYSNPVKEEDVLEPYELEHVLGPLILLAGGLLLSAIVAGIEFCMGSCHTGFDQQIIMDSHKWNIH